MELKFQQEQELRTSVNLEEFQMNNMYNDGLKEFLKSNINEKEIAKSKYGKKLKIVKVKIMYLIFPKLEASN